MRPARTRRPWTPFRPPPSSPVKRCDGHTPDGVRIDRDGNLFVGLYRGGGIAVISRDARLLKYVKLPGAHHANLALSPDRRTIFVTSADDRPDGSYRGELLVVPNPIAP